MKKVLSLITIAVMCIALVVPVFATDGFSQSPGEGGTPCDHKETVLTGQKDPTCTEDGHTGVLVCCDCGEVIDEGSVIEAPGHKPDEDGVCTVCGEKDVPKTGDNSNVLLWVVLMVASAAALVTITSVRRKKA